MAHLHVPNDSEVFGEYAGQLACELLPSELLRIRRMAIVYNHEFQDDLETFLCSRGFFATYQNEEASERDINALNEIHDGFDVEWHGDFYDHAFCRDSYKATY